MFFPRLRRQAKWMFVLLALVFGLGFVIFGVGSNLPSGLGDVLVDPGGGGDGVVSESDARERIEKNPNDAQAYRDLATALQTDGKTAEAITALERYVDLRPRDADVLLTLAGFYRARATRLANQQAVAEARRQELAPPPLAPGLTAQGQPVVDPDPVAQAVAAPLQQRIDELTSEIQTAIAGALDAYKRLTRVEPRDASHQFSLAQTATDAGDYPTAIAAFRRYIKLAPEDPQVPAIRRQIKLLEQAVQQQTAG